MGIGAYQVALVVVALVAAGGLVLCLVRCPGRADAGGLAAVRAARRESSLAANARVGSEEALARPVPANHGLLADQAPTSHGGDGA